MDEGILLVDKPVGWTSFDVVNRVRAVIAHANGKKPRNIKVGHTGTLDPAASGLLVLCVGKKYTRMVQHLIKHDKTYEATVRLGATSTTGDSEGVIKEKKAVPVEKDEILSVIDGFIGESQQKPPMYSAIKVNGKRAYELAREGKAIELKPRPINVYSMELREFEWPLVKLACKVSSGTYIRVLAEDIGNKLGVGGYLSSLKRTTVDKWKVEDSVSPIDVNIDIIREKLLAL